MDYFSPGLNVSPDRSAADEAAFSLFGARMNARALTVLAVPSLLAISSSLATAQATATAPSPSTTNSQSSALPKGPERAIRRDIPMRNGIRRAFAAGTRDSTGRAGPDHRQRWDHHRNKSR